AAPLSSLARAVEVLPGEAGAVMAVPCLKPGGESWAAADTGVLRAGPATFVSGRDRPGPVTVGVEVAFRTLTPPGASPAQGRLIVYGNSEFANNFFIEFLGNKDLLVNTIDWLAREPQAISHRPRRPALGVHQFYVSNEQDDL